MRKKLLVIGATVVLALASLTGCGSKESTGGTTSEEATVTDVANTTEETTTEEVTTEEVATFNSGLVGFAFSYIDGGIDAINDDVFKAYKEGDEFVCGEYVFTPTNPDNMVKYTCDVDSTTWYLDPFYADTDLFSGNVDEFKCKLSGDMLQCKRNGDVIEFTNSDGNKVKMFKILIYSLDGVEFDGGIVIAIDNGVSLRLAGADISQDEFEKFLPLTEGWLTNR